MGMADGGAFAAVKAASIYALPQAAWFLVDIVRYQRRTRNPILDGDGPGGPNAPIRLSGEKPSGRVTAPPGKHFPWGKIADVEVAGSPDLYRPYPDTQIAFDFYYPRLSVGPLSQVPANRQVPRQPT
jgi:hypothetical protein